MVRRIDARRRAISGPLGGADHRRPGRAAAHFGMVEANLSAYHAGDCTRRALCVVAGAAGPAEPVAAAARLSEDDRAARLSRYEAVGRVCDARSHQSLEPDGRAADAPGWPGERL